MKTTFTISLEELKKGIIKEFKEKGYPSDSIKEEDITISPSINEGEFTGLEIEIGVEVA